MSSAAEGFVLSIGTRVAFGHVVPGAIIGGVETANLRLSDDAVAPETAEILDAGPALGGMTFEEGIEPRQQPLDHVGPHRLVEHGCGAYLHRAATEENVGQRLPKIGDPADSG